MPLLPLSFIALGISAVILLGESVLFSPECFLRFLSEDALREILAGDALTLEALRGGLGDREYIALLRRFFEASGLAAVKENLTLAFALVKSRFETGFLDVPFLGVLFLATIFDAYFARSRAVECFSIFSPNRYSLALRLGVLLSLAIALLLATPIESALGIAYGAYAALLYALWTAIRHFHRFGSSAGV